MYILMYAWLYMCGKYLCTSDSHMCSRIVRTVFLVNKLDKQNPPLTPFTFTGTRILMAIMMMMMTMMIPLKRLHNTTYSHMVQHCTMLIAYTGWAKICFIKLLIVFFSPVYLYYPVFGKHNFTLPYTLTLPLFYTSNSKLKKRERKKRIFRRFPS